MTEKREKWGRRREHRYPTAGRITWRKQGDQKERPGWLSDTSRSSMSFVALARTQPSFGEEIELLGLPRIGPRYRVTRIAVYGDDLALIGCHQSSSGRLTN